MLAALAALSLFIAAEARAAERIDVNSIRGPKLEELSMLIITNPDAQILAAEAGELDILSDIARPSDIDRLGAECTHFSFFSTTRISRGTTRRCAARRLCR